MLIGVNALPIRPGMTGIGAHTANLLEALSTSGQPEAYVLHRPGAAVPTRRGMYSVHLTPAAAQFEQFELPGILRRLGIEVFHSPLPTCPLVRPCPAIVTVHDAIPLARPELSSKSFRAYFRATAEQCIASVERIITVSEYSKAEIVRHLRVPEDRVRVVHQPAALCFHNEVSETTRSRVRTRHDLPDRYLLYVGSLEPRKNISCLLDAVRALPKARLVLVGRAQDGFDPDEEVKRRELRHRVQWLSYVPAQDLPALYTLADALVYPSHYEGFGLPVLEAMACGCPVVCSNATSLPEVGGTAVLYADPQSPAHFAERIASLLADDELRHEMAGKGRLRASTFSHKRYMAELLQIYGELVA